MSTHDLQSINGQYKFARQAARVRLADPELEGKRYSRNELSKDEGVLRLLVMQPTSFCNLDCSYCYLPDRHKLNRMSFETVDAVFTDLMTAPFLGRRLSVVWHAGEPLAVGLPFYVRAL